MSQIDEKTLLLTSSTEKRNIVIKKDLKQDQVTVAKIQKGIEDYNNRNSGTFDGIDLADSSNKVKSKRKKWIICFFSIKENR